MIVAPGATSVSLALQVVDDDGLAVTGLAAATFPSVYYSRAGEALPAAVVLSDLAAQSSAYSSGGVKELTGGYYRFDAPDAAFATASRVRIIGEASGKHVLCPAVLVANVPGDLQTVKTQAVTCSGGVTVPAATLASTTNITAGTVTTATNVTTVNGLAAGVITAASIAADAITAAKIADGAIDSATFAAGTTIPRCTLVDTLTTYTSNTPQTGDGFARIGAAGAGLTALGDARLAHLDADVSSRLATSGYTPPLSAAGTRSAVGLASASLDSQLAAIDADVLTRLASSSYTAPPAAATIADKLLGRNLAGGSDGGRTVQDALRFSRNRWTRAGDALTVYAEDDATVAWTSTITSSRTTYPVVESDPA